MKKHYSFPALVFFFLLIDFTAAQSKGCQFYFSYQLDGRTLSMGSIISDPYFECPGAMTYTKIYFGNGDTMSWITTLVSTSKTYVYHGPGEYTLELWTNGHLEETYTIEVVDPEPCDTVFTCQPSFDFLLEYSQTKDEYLLTGTRTNTCEQGSLTWFVGGLSNTKDTLHWNLGKIAEGSTVRVCLNMKLNCADTSTCEDVLVDRHHATWIDLFPDTTVSMNVYPSLVKDWLQIETFNVTGLISLEVYSLNGSLQIAEERSALPAGNTFLLNINTLESGNYLLRIVSPQLTSVRRIMKQ